ncbi:hypothetical protein VOLCADRAFT_74015 [Volvox carteri f. nagariensis]|uniref:Uncharacterized protein n=1 Tax=Volvox carteri f. nagariensis TaxID=3068 RepID=D8TRD3_VOLCA|nr:uncharacterized protein VOLCADRAFT_74015 [Volvox carteri f. nagariensis]EFJ49974.1 hypothetical protein VOLCADRAFT_74015 [Volvox carteri f. nagariensis]|eukprot:XP_002949039.1 hypothetical protein VOLCADRAFT_74015 [Volvox carteri f. nagariensis]
MARAQVERWAAEHPTAPRVGKFFEVPLSYVFPRVAAGLAAAGALWYLNEALFWTHKPESLSPEFLEEKKKIGDVAQRMNGPPVYLNPFSNRIPGSILGPEDVKDA